MGFTVITLGMLFFGAGNAGDIVEVYKEFIRFSGVVFGCYSGNSAYEKYVLRRYAGDEGDDDKGTGASGGSSLG